MALVFNLRLSFLIAALGVTMIYDSSTVMLGHYFKKKRQIVEIFFCSSTGLGMALVSLSTSSLLRLSFVSF
jgi:hypothetical protein